MLSDLISNRKEWAGIAPGPGSLRPGFFGHRSFTAAPFLASRGRTGSSPNPSLHQDPENIQCRSVFIQFKEIWFPGSVSASGVQPVFDSQHDRITCKTGSQPFVKNLKENRRFQSDYRDLRPTPFLVNGGSHKFTSFSLLLIPERRASRQIGFVGP